MLLQATLGLFLQIPLTGAPAPAIEQFGNALRVTGLGFQAHFEADVTTFQPALGVAAPQTETLEFLGSPVLERSGYRRQPKTRSDWSVDQGRLTRQLGADLEERFELAGDRVEHSYVLRQRPGGSGPLRLAIALGGTLAESGTALDDRSVAFLTAQAGGLRVQGVVGVDAVGRREPGWLELVDQSLVYCLPADFVDSAVLPLVVDPWIVPQLTIWPNPADVEGTALSYHGASDQLLLAWIQFYSFTSSDLLALRTTSAGNPLGSLIPVETSPTESTGYPKLALWEEQSTWLLIYRKNFTPQEQVSRLMGFGITTSGVVGATTELATAPATFPFAYTTTGPVDAQGRVFYCTTRGFVDSSYYHYGHRADLGLDAAGVPFVVPKLEGPLLASFHGNIAYAQYPVSGDRRLIAMTEALGGNPETGTRIALRLSNAVGSGASYQWIELPGFFIKGMYLSGQGDEFALVYDRYLMAPPAPSVLIGYYARAIRVLGDSLIIGPEVLVPIPPTANTAFLRKLNFCGESYQVLLVGAAALPQGGSINGVSVMELDAVSLQPRYNSTFSFVNALVESAGAPSGVEAVGFLDQAASATDSLLVAWSNSATSPLFASAYRSPGQVQPLGGGCGQGGQTRASHAATGTYVFSPGISGAAPASPAILVVAATSTPIDCGPCIWYPELATPIFIGSGITDALGRASWPLPIPINPALVGFQFQAQGAVFVPAAACPLFALDLSNAVAVTIE